MNAIMLLKSVSVFVRNTVSDYAAAQNKNGEYVTPRVFESFLPFKDGRNEEKLDFPYITVRISDGQDTDEESFVNVNLYFGIYRKGEEVEGFTQPDGAYDLLALMEHVRVALFRQGSLDMKFEIQKPYKWEIPDEQPYPLWVGWAMSKWDVPAPIRQHEGSFLHG